MTAQVAGIPAYENLVAEEPRRPGSVRRHASAGRRVAKATFYTFAIVFVTGIFVGLLLGMNSAYADDGGGSGGDGGSSSAGSSASSGGDGGSSSASSGDGGSSASSGDSGSSSSAGDSSSGDGSSTSTGAGVSSTATGGGDSSSSANGGDSSSSGNGGDSSSSGNGGDSSSSANGGDSSSSANGGDSSSASAGSGVSAGTDGDAASTANEGSSSTPSENSSAAGTAQSVATSGDTPSATVGGESTSVDGISVSNVSVDAPDPSGFALGTPNADAAVATSAQPGEATTAETPADTPAQSSETQTADPNAVATVPGTVVDDAPSFLSAADLATLAAVAQVGLDEDPAGVPAQQNADEAVTTPVPGIVVDNAVSFLSPEDLSAIRALAQVGAVDENAPPVANPDEVIAAGVPGIVVDDAVSFLSPEDLAAVREAQKVGLDEGPAGYFQPIATMEDELGRQYVLGVDFSIARRGLGARLGVQFDPPAITMMARAWPIAKPLGFQGYALSMPGVKPGLESVDLFAQAQVPIDLFANPKPTVKIGEGPVVVGVEGAFSPFQAPENRFTITGYVAGQVPFKDTPIGAAWGIAMDHYNPITGRRSSDEGYGWGIGGMTGVAVGARGAIGLNSLTGWSSPSRNGRTK